jgi:hypothetical protein
MIRFRHDWWLSFHGYRTLQNYCVPHGRLHFTFTAPFFSLMHKLRTLDFPDHCFTKYQIHLFRWPNQFRNSYWCKGETIHCMYRNRDYFGDSSVHDTWRLLTIQTIWCSFFFKKYFVKLPFSSFGDHLINILRKVNRLIYTFKIN